MILSRFAMRGTFIFHLFAQKLGAFLDHLRTYGQRESLDALKDQSKLEAFGTNLTLIISTSELTIFS